MSDENTCKYEEETMSAWDGDTAWVCSICGETWFLANGSPQENNMNYCPNCGRKIVEYVPLSPDIEEEDDK